MSLHLKMVLRLFRLTQFLSISIKVHGRSGVLFPGRSNQTQCRQRLANAARFPRCCVALALNRGDILRHSLLASDILRHSLLASDILRHSLHASAQHRQYHEDLFLIVSNICNLRQYYYFRTSPWSSPCKTRRVL